MQEKCPKTAAVFLSLSCVFLLFHFFCIHAQSIQFILICQKIPTKKITTTLLKFSLSDRHPCTQILIEKEEIIVSRLSRERTHLLWNFTKYYNTFIFSVHGESQIQETHFLRACMQQLSKLLLLLMTLYTTIIHIFYF